MTAAPTTMWRWGTAAQRAALCSAISAATTNRRTSKAAPTSSGWSLCPTDRSTKPGLQPTFSKARLLLYWRFTEDDAFVQQRKQIVFFWIHQRWTSAPSLTTATVSSAVWTHWAATDVPVTLDMSWQQTGVAVRVSAEHNSTPFHNTHTLTHPTLDCILKYQTKPIEASAGVCCCPHVATSSYCNTYG